MKELFDEAEVRGTLAKLIRKRCVFEIRAVKARLKSERRRGTVSGYFDNADSCIAALGKLSEAQGIYVTMNPVDPALLARRANRLDYVEAKDTTGDQHIVQRRWLVIDVDFKRASGISATDEQKAKARRKAIEVRDFLREKRGWRNALVADSGNGFHLVYPTDLPSDDDGLVEMVLAALAGRFDDGGVEIDRTVFNPARIIRLYGTLAAKGDDTPERPHRFSKILKAPLLKKVGKDQLQALVDESQPSEESDHAVDLKHGVFDVEQFLARYGVEAEKTTEPDGAIKWTLAQCPFNPDHKSPDAAVFQGPDGKLGFKCFHNSCVDKSWKDFRQHFEPAPTGKDRRNDNEWATDLSSFTSSVGDYPEPMDDAAFYGLAGEIVRKIEPQTEADPAALLTVTLVGLGNMIGHVDKCINPQYHAYSIADGSYHFLNEYAVLVGATGIGRKGTAQANVKLGFLQHVDPAWSANIASGLSSGEGLIWQVRDAITREVKGEREVVDAGVGDKRLTLFESEFASVLKVMAREGCTLSPVLRLAWDGASILRTMTKNSPAKATNALISMIGHITPEELRRWLNEIEAANGFGNRILWCACKRSKLLPEGGKMIGADDLIERLQTAVKFAQGIGQITRDDAAKELWRHVYPQLTTAKAGLLGAILARAEAHVLRLSNLFAVLDMKHQVGVAHLRAALAAWDYYRRTAHWQFATGTGNRYADSVLAALKIAGNRGLTKWEIVSNVFNRNVTKFKIDEALRMLFVLKSAHRTEEASGGRGRPTERWFYRQAMHEGNDINEENGQKVVFTSFTSFTSSPAPSQNASSAESNTEAVFGDAQL